MTRVSYLIIGPYTWGWRDLPSDRSVTVQRDGVLHGARVADLKRGDIVRGVNHSRLITGPPVRIGTVRPI